jgi:hypothetical protein
VEDEERRKRISVIATFAATVTTDAIMLLLTAVRLLPRVQRRTAVIVGSLRCAVRVFKLHHTSPRRIRVCAEGAVACYCLTLILRLDIEEVVQRTWSEFVVRLRGAALNAISAASHCDVCGSTWAKVPFWALDATRPIAWERCEGTSSAVSANPVYEVLAKSTH